MRDKYFWATLLLVIGFVAAGALATDFTGAVGSDWAVANNWTAGVPNSATLANIGTATYPSATAVITGSADAGRTVIGAGGGASAAASLTISANSSLNIWGSFYNSDEDEDHGFDIGGMGSASLTLEANAALNMMAGDMMGLGKDDRWVGGYDTSIVMKPGSSILVASDGSGWATFGLGDGNYHQVLDMDSATITGTLFHIGGTLIVRGTCIADGTYKTHDHAGRPILKPVGSGAILTATDSPLNELDVDVSELPVTVGVWTTIFHGDFMYYHVPDINFVPGTDPNWRLRWTPGEDALIEVRYIPDPATLSLLALGAIGLAVRRRK